MKHVDPRLLIAALLLLAGTACKGSSNAGADAVHPLCESLCQAPLIAEPDADPGDSGSTESDLTAVVANGCSAAQISACESTCQARTAGASTLCISCRLDGASFNSGGSCEATFRSESACIDLCGK